MQIICSQRYKQGLVVIFYSSDVIVHKGYSERKEREERKKYISSLERTYHIYSHKRPTSNQRPPRIGAHPKGKNWKDNKRPASNKCRISVRLVLQVYYYVAIVFIISIAGLSHDVTKIQTTKLSFLPRFYFHDVLEQLKTNFHTNFRFKRFLGL